MKRKSRNKSASNREGISYKSGITLTLDPDLLQKAVVTPQELKEFEKYVPTFSERPSKTKTVLKALALYYLTRKRAVEANKLKSFN